MIGVCEDVFGICGFDDFIEVFGLIICVIVGYDVFGFYIVVC